MYYRGAAGAIVVYDITDSDSFTGAKTYVEELQRQGSSDIVIALAGNKKDLENKREVWEADALAYAKENNCIFFECSAKSGENVVDIFEAIGARLPKTPVATHNNNDFVRIVSDDEKPKSGCCN